MRMLPRQERVSELSGATEFDIKRTESAVGLTTVARIVIAIKETFLALVQAMSGPAVFVREVENGVPQREVALKREHNTIEFIRTTNVKGIIVETIAIRVDPSNVIDIGWPITTVADRRDLVSTEVNVQLSSESSIPELRAVVGRARMIIALPVLLVEHTSIRDKRKTRVRIKLRDEAFALGGSTAKNSTSTNANTSSPVTITSS
jgi:hypothetical protein